ncbi:hypothetical protein WJX74_001280 [Apatococcus lobatus]|uniref:Uncharacterized protein n=1 Tax=Apatococcus lobatus TaxID=904363 RepID=A0AAW1RB29_9CHLO
MLSLYTVLLVAVAIPLSLAAPDAHLQGLLKQAADIQPWMLEIRRHLHQWPETMYDEHNTSAYLRQQLDSLAISYQHPVAETGIVATIGKGGPVVGLRTDIDALPIQEQTGLPFASKGKVEEERNLGTHSTQKGVGGLYEVEHDGHACFSRQSHGQ